MRTPKQWVHIWSQSKASNLINSILEGEQIVEATQKEALSNAMKKISDKKELEIAQTIISNQRILTDYLNQEVIRWKEKYHESRRYLRQANKGAERNNLIIQLQAELINKLRSLI